jgi:hypothetical protein
MKNIPLFLALFLIPILGLGQNTAMVSGSGIVLSKDGYIATNNHVIENGLEYFVDIYTNGIKQSFKAKVIQADKENDLAVIKIVDPLFKPFKSIPYAFRMQGINVGEKVFAMGYPRPGIQGEEVKITDGLISSKTGFQNDNKSFQISAPIQPGNSGGPLFDYSGNLIGLTSSGIPSGENVGYAIKISYLNNLIDLVPNFPILTATTTTTNLSFTEKIKILSNYTVMIRVVIPDCDLKTPSELFNTINAGSTVKGISAMLGMEGENYRNDGSGISFYKWVLCENDKTFIDCWLKDGKMYLSMKSFNNPDSRYILNEEMFKLIKPGMTYEAICKLLVGPGEMYRTDYMSSIKFFRWIDSYNQDLYFDVWFLNNKVHLVRKGDFAKEKSLLGE